MAHAANRPARRESMENSENWSPDRTHQWHIEKHEARAGQVHWNWENAGNHCGKRGASSALENTSRSERRPAHTPGKNVRQSTSISLKAGPKNFSTPSHGECSFVLIKGEKKGHATRAHEGYDVGFGQGPNWAPSQSVRLVMVGTELVGRVGRTG